MARYNGIETDQNGAIVPGAKIYVYQYDGETLASLTDDFDSAMPNPVVSDSLGAFYFNVASQALYTLKHLYTGRYVRYEVIPVGTLIAAVNPSLPNAGKFIALDADGAPTYASGTGADSALRTDLAASGGSALAGFIQPGAGAIQRSAQAKIREISLSIRDFPSAGFDATQALNWAMDQLGTDGGAVDIPPIDLKLNATLDRSNILLRGKGGLAEFDRVVLRPFSLAAPAITLSDGVGDIRYIAFENLHISGSDGTTNGLTKAANNAPQALLLNGGTVNFHASNCAFYNGVQTVALVPSATNPVTTNVFLGCTIRNDLTDSVNARAIYEKRLAADNGYATANKFIATKVNGPTQGYAAEIDGSEYPLQLEVNDSYWDVKPGAGVLLKGGSTIICFNFVLDSGPGGPHVIIKTDQAQSDPSRLINGSMRHGGQLIEFASAVTVALDPGCEMFGYGALVGAAYLSSRTFFTTAAAPFANSVYMERVGANLVLAGAPLVVDQGLSTNTDLRVDGVKVVGNQGAAVANATDAASAITQLNALLARCRAHGLIA